MSDVIWPGGRQVKVTGLGDVSAALKKAGADATDLREVVHDVGMIVVNAALPKMRERTGAMKDTLRAGRGKQKAVVRAGGGPVAWAATNEYGFAARNISPSFAINTARSENRDEIVDRFESGIEDVLRNAGLI